MSTEETIETKAAPCPCGKGQITRVVISPDNPWSRVHISFRVDCAECQGIWIANSGYLEHASDKRTRDKLYADLRQLENELQLLVRDGVNAYFSKFRDMAKQQREMGRLMLSRINLVDYRKAIKRGETPADCCYPTNNPSWFMEIAETMGVASEAARLNSAILATKAALADAKVRHHSFSE